LKITFKTAKKFAKNITLKLIITEGEIIITFNEPSVELGLQRNQVA
jgi:hypothetical protein